MSAPTPPPFDYTSAVCPMSNCNEDLYLDWSVSMLLLIGNITDGKAIDIDPYVSAWKVTCTDGHVVLLPTPYPGCMQDGVCKGDCSCDVDHSEETRTFRASDAARLNDLFIRMEVKP